ncbi:hypothetical protein XELAEV_18021411mg [Xenopus laevis]|uniref:Uncharacterized protein n=1 Tax=Xenopus laevis TaxID=8355 RepID=A0A974DBG9_XENLA|nr:hypothetical protein XELAEV_18021411mg [Xenopus laevis]
MCQCIYAGGKMSASFCPDTSVSLTDVYCIFAPKFTPSVPFSSCWASHFCRVSVKANSLHFWCIPVQYKFFFYTKQRTTYFCKKFKKKLCP